MIGDTGDRDSDTFYFFPTMTRVTPLLLSQLLMLPTSAPRYAPHTRFAAHGAMGVMCQREASFLPERLRLARGHERLMPMLRRPSLDSFRLTAFWRCLTRISIRGRDLLFDISRALESG